MSKIEPHVPQGLTLFTPQGSSDEHWINERTQKIQIISREVGEHFFLNKTVRKLHFLASRYTLNKLNWSRIYRWPYALRNRIPIGWHDASGSRRASKCSPDRWKVDVDKWPVFVGRSVQHLQQLWFARRPEYQPATGIIIGVRLAARLSPRTCRR